MHHADQNRVFAQDPLDHCRRGQPVFVGVKIGYVVTFPLQLPARIENRLVLNLGGNDMLTFLVIEMRHSLNAKVVRLGCP